MKNRKNLSIKSIFILFFVSIALCSWSETPFTSQQAQQIDIQQQLNRNFISNSRTNIQAVSNVNVSIPKSNLALNSSFRANNDLKSTGKFKTVKTLVPYEDLYKVLQKDIGKYFILPIDEFEKLKKAKEDWIKSQNTPQPLASPIQYRINSARFTGDILENYANITATFKIETFTDEWHKIPLMWGNLAIKSAQLDGIHTSLQNDWMHKGSSRQFTFGKIRRRNSIQKFYQSQGQNSEILSQNNWEDVIYSLPIKGAGAHVCKINFMVPIENKDDLYSLNFSLSRIPLTFLKLGVKDFILSIDSTNFKDYTIDSRDDNSNGCDFIGWLGAESTLYLKWRKKFVKPKKVKKTVKPEISPKVASTTIVASEPVEIEKPEPVILPLVYCRVHTLVSLDETSIQGFKTIQYTISKAPVSSFTFLIPNNVEVTYVNADRPHNHRLIRDGKRKLLRVSFPAGREDNCRIELSYEAPVDLNKKLIKIPEVYPINVERELGAIAIEALTSVEVQPGNDDKYELGKGVYPIDSSEVPQALKRKASRPILQAYRYNSRPTKIRLRVKRYKDVEQQTVAADSMEAKTTFTTNETSNTLLELEIRNNNKQYLQLQLASTTEVVSAFRDGKPVKIVAGKNNGKVQIPLKMSQSVGSPVSMKLQLLLKAPTTKMKWKGNMNFKLPLVDIPVSHFSWYLYAPEQYHLFNFRGTVKTNKQQPDPFFFRGFITLVNIAQSILLSPDTLFVFLFFVVITILILSRKLFMKIVSAIWNAVTGIFVYLFSGKGINLISLVVVLTIIAALFAIAVPNFRKARTQAREKACYANMRVLLGAVEMYNMDHEKMMRNLDVNRLADSEYLRKIPEKPTKKCSYSNLGRLGDGGVIQCRVHGTVESEAPGASSFGDSRNDYDMAKNMSRQKKKGRKLAGKMSYNGFSKQNRTMTKGKNIGYGAAKSKGVLPIKSKFVMTSNFYALERDLIIADTASNGKLLYNETCPKVKVSYLNKTVLTIVGVVSLILALFSGLYFVSGAFLASSSKVTFAAIIIILLSVLDFNLGTIGDLANIGFWLSITLAIIWKIIWLISQFDFINYDPDGDLTVPPAGTPSKSKNIKTNIKRAMNSNDDLTSIPSFGASETIEKGPVSKGPDNKSGKGNHLIVVLLFIFSIIFISLPTFAGNNEREIRVMAPFKELSKVIPTGDRVVIIPESDYRYLQDINVPEKPEIKAPYSYRFESAKYSGKLEKNGARLRAEFKITLYNKGWKQIELLSSEAVPTTAVIDDKPLALTLFDNKSPSFYGFMTNATGTVNVEVSFFVPISSSEFKHTSKFSLNTVPVCLSTLEIEVDEKNCDAWVDPGFLLTPEKNNDKTVFKAVLPPTSKIRFELYRNIVEFKKPEPPKPKTKKEEKKVAPVVIEEKTRVSVVESNLLYFKEGFVSGINNYNFKIKGGTGIATFTFRIPPKIRILKVENKLIEDWKIDKERRLNIVFKSQIRGNTNIQIIFEEDIQNLKNETYSVPEIIPTGVEQAYGILGIGCLDSLEVSVGEIPEGYSPIVAAEFLKSWPYSKPPKTPYAFKFLRHPNKLRLTVTRPEDISQQTAVIDRAEAMSLLNEDGYLLSRIVYEVRNNSQQFLKVRLPKIASVPTELWSTQVAGLSVRTGFDPEFGVYNIPIIRSPIDNGETKSFPVEIVYAIKMKEALKPATHIHIELPQTHLPISELSWQLYLPDGYEVMREQGNMDRKLSSVEQKFLNNSSYFSSISSIREKSKRRRSWNKLQYQKQQVKLGAMSGQLPVKFKIPTTSWSTSFTMLQIEPEGKAPYIDAVIFNPRKGKGNVFQILMIVLGAFAGIGLINLFIGIRKYAWFLFFALQCVIIGSAIYMKIYQADHFAQMGFGALITLYVLYKFFAWRPESKKDKVKK